MQGEDDELSECDRQCSGHFQPSRGFSRVKGLIPGLYIEDITPLKDSMHHYLQDSMMNSSIS